MTQQECGSIEQAGASKFLGDAAVLTIEIGTPLLLTCLECGVRTCAICRLLSDHHTTDDGLRCPENVEVEDLKKVVDDMGLPPTQCPSCAHLCERSEGCPVLTCVCGTKFCYICGQQAGDDERRECECADPVAPGWNGQQEEDWDSDDEEEDMWPEVPFQQMQHPVDHLSVFISDTEALLERIEQLQNAPRTAVDDEAVTDEETAAEQNEKAVEGHADHLVPEDTVIEAPIDREGVGLIMGPANDAAAANDPVMDDVVETVVVDAPPESADNAYQTAVEQIQSALEQVRQARETLDQANITAIDLMNDRIRAELDARAVQRRRA